MPRDLPTAKNVVSSYFLFRSFVSPLFVFRIKLKTEKYAPVARRKFAPDQAHFTMKRWSFVNQRKIWQLKQYE